MERVSLVILFTSAGLSLAARYQHFVVHPEWTEAQSLRNLWPWYVASVAGTLIAIFLLNKFNTQER